MHAHTNTHTQTHTHKHTHTNTHTHTHTHACMHARTASPPATLKIATQHTQLWPTQKHTRTHIHPQSRQLLFANAPNARTHTHTHGAYRGHGVKVHVVLSAAAQVVPVRAAATRQHQRHGAPPRTSMQARAAASTLRLQPDGGRAARGRTWWRRTSQCTGRRPSRDRLQPRRSLRRAGSQSRLGTPAGSGTWLRTHNRPARARPARVSGAAATAALVDGRQAFAACGQPPRKAARTVRHDTQRNRTVPAAHSPPHARLPPPTHSRSVPNIAALSLSSCFARFGRRHTLPHYRRRCSYYILYCANSDKKKGADAMVPATCRAALGAGEGWGVCAGAWAALGPAAAFARRRCQRPRGAAPDIVRDHARLRWARRPDPRSARRAVTFCPCCQRCWWRPSTAFPRRPCARRPAHGARRAGA